jgi:hypothetical protein
MARPNPRLAPVTTAVLPFRGAGVGGAFVVGFISGDQSLGVILIL